MDRIVTKTLAEIYLQQGHLQEAYEMFRTLSEKDPSDGEIKERLKELEKRLNPSPSLTDPSVHSTEDKIRILEKWLVHIRKRRKS